MRLVTMTVTAAVALTSVIAVGLLPQSASAAGDPAQLAVTSVGISPATGLSGGDGTYVLEADHARDQQELAFAYTCPADGSGACVDAAFTLDLSELTLAGFLAPDASVPGSYTVAHYDAADVLVDPVAGAASDVRRVVVTFADDVDGTGVGLHTGTTGQLFLTATVTPPPGGGEQTGGVTITPEDEFGSGPSASITVETTFVPTLSTTTGKSWSVDDYLSGASGVPGTTNVATIVATNTSEPAGTLTVSDPAVPSTVPSGAAAFNVLAMTGLEIAAWPAGAATVDVTVWDAGVARPSSGPLDETAAAAWLTALADPRDVTGISLTFAAAPGGAIEADASATVALTTEQYDSTDGAVLGRDGNEVDFSRLGGLDGGFGKLAVSNSARTVAGSDVPGTTPGTSDGAAAFTIHDPRPYAGAAKVYTAPGDAATTVGQVPIGSYAVATITATNWTRQAVDTMGLVERPTQGQIDENPAVLGLGTLSDGMFAGTGFVFAGFGDGFATPGDPTGGANAAGLVWPSGATGATVGVTYGSPATTVDVPLTVGDPLPALADVAGLADWADVTGLSIVFEGTIPTGATGSVPYLLTPGAAAVPGSYDNHVLARTTLGSDTSGASPRSADSGNRPIVRAPLTVEAPTVGVGVDKQIPQTHVDVTGGEVTAVLRATSVPGNTEPTTLVIDDRRTDGNRWWQVMEPTSVDITVSVGDTAVLSYWDGTTLVEHGTYTTSTQVSLPAGAGDWDGLRVSYTRADGFPAESTVQAVVTFAVRSTPVGGGSFADLEVVTNCAAARAEVEYNGQTYSGTAGPACDAVTGYANTGGAGPTALTKSLGGSVREGSGGQRTATLTWGTAGQDLDSVTITDGNAIDAAGVPGEGRGTSFWDTFDLVRIPAITSGPAASGTSAYDPFLIFDQVTAVEYFDVTDDTWKTVAAASGLPYRGTAASAANGWTVLPGITLNGAERAVAGGVRLTVAPLDVTDRATVTATLVAAGDWRASALAAGLTDLKVAATASPARQIKLDVALRDTSRATGGVVNDAHAYNAGSSGLVVNDARVDGDVGGVRTGLGGAANHPSQRTVTITPTVLSAAATKDWRRAGDNPSGGADNSGVRDLPLPAGGEPWPSATLTVSGRNTSATPVDSLSLHEPANTSETFRGSVDNPFSWFAVTDVVSLTDVGGVAGATTMTVTLHEHDSGTGSVQTRTVTRAELLAMTETDLADVVGIDVGYDGRIASGGSSRTTLVLTTRLLEENRFSGASPTANLSIANEVRATVGDARVCTDEPGGPAVDPCERQPVSDTADDTLTVSDAAVKAFVGKQIDRTSVYRDAGTPIAATLSIQSFGNSAADSLVLTDDDARYFNAVGLTGIELVSLPTGAEQAGLEVALAAPGFTVTADGAYSAPITWVDAGTRTAAGSFALAADATGASWSDVLAVRVTFRDTDGDRIASPGTVLGAVRLAGELRTELVSGGLPSAVGAGDTWAGEVGANPAETVRGQVTNVVTGQAHRPGFTSGTPTQSGDSFSVQAGTVEVGTTKTSPVGVYGPGDPVDYTIEVTNQSSPGTGAHTLGLVVTDRLPADGTLVYDPVGSTWSAAVTSGDDRLGTPTVTHDAEAATVTFTWPDDARLAPGQTVRIGLRLFVAEQLSSIQVVNRASAGVTSRPVDPGSGGGSEGTTCAPPSDTDPVTGECHVTSGALVLGGASTFASAKWVSTGHPVPVHTTDPGATATCAPRGAGADGTWFRFPCVAQAVAGGSIDWQVEVTSLATAPSDDLTIIDMLATPGDYSALATGSRGSAWRPVWDGVLPQLVAVPGQNPGATLEVWTTTADYRSGGLPATTAFDPVPGTWTLATGDLAAADAAEVTGFRFEVSFPGGSRFVSGQSIRVGWSMDAPVGGASNGTDAWNSFAFRVQPDGSPLPLTSVPLKAGARYTTPSYAAGDVVWLDHDRDGVQDAGEPGVPDVTVRIFEVDAGGVVAPTPRATTTTGPDGRYLFDLLPAGDYLVEFALDAVQAARYEFTTPTAGTDPGVDSDAVVDGDVTLGRTAVFTLDGAGTNPNMRPVTGPDGSAADLIDPTLDAGLVELPVRVGDLVWFDADGDGLQSSDEDGIPGVVLEITDTAGLPVVDVHGAPVVPTTTDPDGRYIFENLPPGEYVVRIDRVASRAALLGYAPTLEGEGADREADSATWRDGSRVLVGGEEDLSLDFGFVLRDGVGLAITKNPGAIDESGPSPRVTWDLVVASTGTDDAYAGFTVTDPMPEGLTAIGAEGDGFVCAVTPTLVTCVHDEALASGATATVRVLTELTADPGVAVRNVAEVSGDDHPYLTPVPPAEDDGTVVVPEQPEALVPPVEPGPGGGVLGATGAQVVSVVALAVLLTGAGACLLRIRRRAAVSR